MKKILPALLLFMSSLTFAADVKISQLPLGSAASTISTDSFPYVNSITATTQRLTLWDLVNLPPLTTTFAPLASPTFTGTVTAPTFVGALTGTATGNTTYTADAFGVVTSGAANVMNVIAPSSSTAFPLVSQGTLSNPHWAPLTVPGGGTGVTSVTTAPTVSSFAGWDANANMSANSFIPGYTTTATGATTTTLTVTSTGTQYFTGSTTQTVMLPVTSTLVNGQRYRIVNMSSGNVTVQSSGANNLQVMIQNTFLEATVISTSGTGTSSWDWTYGAVKATATPMLNPMTTSQDIIVGGASGTPNRLGVGSNGQVLSVASGSLGYNTLTAPTKQIFTSNGTVAGYVFYVSGISVAPTAGATYTNNGHTFTVLSTTNTNSLIWTTGTSAPTSPTGTLTKTGGTGDSTVSFSNNNSLAVYTTPAGANLLKVTLVGGGGGSGGVASGASTSAASGGGGGGSTCIKWISSPGASYYYAVGVGGGAGSSGNNSGTVGILSGFGNNSTFYVALGGSQSGGSPADTAGTATFGNVGGAGGVSTGCDVNIQGSFGGIGQFWAGNAIGGTGGSSLMGGGVAGNTVSTPGVTGLLYGGGAAGASQLNNGGAQAGGIGGGGIVIVEEYYQ